jgi:hypothetical protein
MAAYHYYNPSGGGHAFANSVDVWRSTGIAGDTPGYYHYWEIEQWTQHGC